MPKGRRRGVTTRLPIEARWSHIPNAKLASCHKCLRVRTLYGIACGKCRRRIKPNYQRIVSLFGRGNDPARTEPLPDSRLPGPADIGEDPNADETTGQQRNVVTGDDTTADRFVKWWRTGPEMTGYEA